MPEEKDKNKPDVTEGAKIFGWHSILLLIAGCVLGLIAYFSFFSDK
ncbi:hypothetical protein QJS83_09060 [Bdellovibrio sp. 22V]|nr:hypothetical protein [Bdellovibrio sp. 22V]WII70605.1 hypothetical protein QJS83_09060 [Bdellovibrio sp. 22V]